MKVIFNASILEKEELDAVKDVLSDGKIYDVNEPGNNKLGLYYS